MTKSNQIKKVYDKTSGYINHWSKQFVRDFSSSFSLIAKSYFKDIQALMSTFVIPTFFFVIFYFLMKNFSTSLIGYLMLPALTVMTSLSSGLVQWKNSVFLKRIDTTGIRKGTFLLSIWVFYLIMCFVGTAVEIVVGLIIAQHHAIDQYNDMNWGWFILGTVFVSLLSIGMATLIAGLISNAGAAQGITMMIYFISMFLSGMMIPYNAIGDVTALRIISYFIPHMYANAVVTHSQTPWLFDVNIASIGNYHTFTHIWQPCVGSAGLIAILFGVNAFTFRWSSNK